MPAHADRLPVQPPRDLVAERRRSLFSETPLETCQRVALGLAWVLKPERLRGVPALARLWLADKFGGDGALPDPERTYDASGLAGMVRDLSVPTLVEAYKRGLFSSGHFGALHWTSLPERCVLFFDEFHMAKRLRRLMRQGRYTVTFDRDFESVIKACAGRRTGKWHVTWITPRIMRAYADLFDAGHVHSFEVWNEGGDLVGGGYGVAVGRVFYTESQFSHERDTSKLGFSVLNWHLAHWGYLLNDGKNPTPTILDMGFRSIPRAEFLRLLADGTASGGKAGRWNAEAGPQVVADWQPQKTVAESVPLLPPLHGPNEPAKAR